MVSDITEKNWKKFVSPKVNHTLWKAVGVFVFKLKLLGEIKKNIQLLKGKKENSYLLKKKKLSEIR